MGQVLKASKVIGVEDFPPDFERDAVGYVVDLVELAESVSVVAKIGSGLTTLLRFICFNKRYMQRPGNVKWVYLDQAKWGANFLGAIQRLLRQEIERTRNQKISLVIDDLPWKTMTVDDWQVLNAIKSKYRSRVAMVLGLSLPSLTMEAELKARVKKLTGENMLAYHGLSKGSFLWMANYLSTIYQIPIAKKEVEDWYKSMEGSPTLLKRRFQAQFKEQKLARLDWTVPSDKGSDKGNELRVNGVNLADRLTKSEELVCKLLLENRGAIVHRDQIAAQMAPESEGAGVSNEAIDQIAYRLRRKLEKLKLGKVKISTVHGRGYKLEE